MTAVTVAALVVVQALFAVSWFAALRVPAATGGRVVVLAAALAADVTVLAGDESRPMALVPPVLAGALLAAVLHQLLRRGGREGLTASLTATVAAATFVALGSAWLALQASQDGGALVVLAVVAAAAAPAADGVRRATSAPGWIGPAAALVVTLAGGLVVAASTAVGTTTALVTAAAAAVTARLGLLLAERIDPRDPLVTATLPALLVAPVAYLLARVLLG